MPPEAERLVAVTSSGREMKHKSELINIKKDPGEVSCQETSIKEMKNACDNGNA